MLLSNVYFDIDLNTLHFLPTTPEDDFKRRYILDPYIQHFKFKRFILPVEEADILLRYKLSEILNKYVDIKYEFTKEEVLKIKGNIDKYDNTYIGSLINPNWLDEKINNEFHINNGTHI